VALPTNDSWSPRLEERPDYTTRHGNAELVCSTLGAVHTRFGTGRLRLTSASRDYPSRRSSVSSTRCRIADNCGLSSPSALISAIGSARRSASESFSSSELRSSSTPNARSIQSQWAGLAALGVLGAALTSFATTRESIGQDARNAERYGRTRAALRRLTTRLDDVREAVAQGNAQALEEFVAAVNEQVSVEHRQWLNDGDSTRAGMARLEIALQRSAEDAPTEERRTLR
jgi:hypothetical protein